MIEIYTKETGDEVTGWNFFIPPKVYKHFGLSYQQAEELSYLPEHKQEARFKLMRHRNVLR